MRNDKPFRRLYTREDQERIFKALEQVAANEAATQKKIEFIVEQQAQFSADLGKLTGDLAQLAEDVGKLTGVVGQMQDVLNETQELVKRLTVVTHAGFQKLTEAQATTDERLNVLINTVERYISERRNGKE